MTGSLDRHAVVRTLSIRSAGEDVVLARLRAEHLLGAVDLRLPGLPPSAILCVRHLRDPRPGVLSLDGRSLRPPRVWEAALVAELEVITRRAVRPWQGGAGAATEAVLFWDRSELLACLASDMLRGDVGARWWWASLLPDARDPRAVPRAWVEAPAHVPGAAHLLAERGEIELFSRSITSDEVRAIARAVADRWGAPVIAAAVERVSARAELQPSVRRREEPWVAFAPEVSTTALDDGRRALAGVALALHRAPAVARSLAFTAAIQQWCASAEAAAGALDDGGGERQARNDGREARAPLADGLAVPASQAIQSQGLATGSTHAPREELFAEAPSAHAKAGPPAFTHRHEAPRVHAIHAPRLDAPPARTQEWGASEIPGTISRSASAASFDAAPAPWPVPQAPAPAVPPSLDSAPSVTAAAPLHTSDPPVAADPSPALPAPAPSAAPTPFAAPAPAERPVRRLGTPIATRFGGLFFLVNLGLYLDLYGDFSTPLSPGIDLPIWDFIALVGRDLAGPVVEADPVWPLLADLAGRREGEPPGHAFVPPLVFQPPASWLRPLRGGKHVPLPTPAIPAGATPLESWLGHVLPYVRARLALALPMEGWSHALCAIPARVHVTTTHLDVAMSLADLPIEVRLAGLDRDPGWVPAAGRYIAFHFN
jgi:hypothetical protein